MEELSGLQAVLDIFGVGSTVLMVSVAVFAYILRGWSWVPRSAAIAFPTLIGGAIGVIVALVANEGKVMSPAALALALITGFLAHGAAATISARLAYPRLAKYLPVESQQQPPAGGAS